jgi:hypothetical protein
MGGLTKEDFDQFFKSFWKHIRVEERIAKDAQALLVRGVPQPKK